MHVAQLRKEFDDAAVHPHRLRAWRSRPGGLRLASRAVEILGLQDRTVREVSQAGDGRRVLRVAASHLFAEHAAPGLIDLFAGRADDLEVELSVRPVAQFPALLAGAHGRRRDRARPRAAPPDRLVQLQFLVYEVVAVARPDHPLAGRAAQRRPGARQQLWCLGPSAVGPTASSPRCSAGWACPSSTSGSSRATPPRSRRPSAATASPWRCSFAVAGDLAAGRLVALDGPGLRTQGRWAAMALPAHDQTPADRRAAALHHHAARHPGDGPRRGRPPRPVQAGRPRHPVELSGARVTRDRVEDLRAARAGCRPAGRRRSTAAPPPSTRPAARSPERRRAGSATRRGGPGARPSPSPRPASAGSSLSQPSEAITRTPPRTALPCRDAAARRGTTPGGCRRTGRRPASPAMRHRGRGRVVRQGRGQPRQRGRERERLRPPGPRERPHQVQVRRRVALHRLADVAQQRHGQRAGARGGSA